MKHKTIGTTATDPECDDVHEPVSRPGLDASIVEHAATLFRTVGEPARLRLLERLSWGEYCVSELAAGTGDQLSTISERLRVLRAAGLVQRRRQGRHIYYSLADRHVVELIRSALDHASELEGAPARARAS